MYFNETTCAVRRADVKENSRSPGNLRFASKLCIAGRATAQRLPSPLGTRRNGTRSPRKYVFIPLAGISIIFSLHFRLVSSRKRKFFSLLFFLNDNFPILPLFHLVHTFWESHLANVNGELRILLLQFLFVLSFFLRNEREGMIDSKEPTFTCQGQKFRECFQIKRTSLFLVYYSYRVRFISLFASRNFRGKQILS